MNSSHPALDDPCPCGSGKKYGYCCLLKPNAAPSGSALGSDSVFEDLHRELAGRDLGSLDDVQNFADGFMDRRNRAVLDEFHGLSPEQMYMLLYSPFDSPGLVTFPEHISLTPEAPILTLFSLLADAIGEQGLKCTATGNLPLAFCKAAAKIFRISTDEGNLRRIGGIRSELDFFELHVTRLVSVEAGLVRKYKGRFKLTRECQRLLAGSDPAAIYLRLFRSYAQRYNWSYGDGYPELPFIQQSFLFTLYLLHRHGAAGKPESFYADAYLQAFPMLAEEVEPESYSTPEAQVKNCYALRTLERFAGFLGLARVENVSTKTSPGAFRITKKPLLDQVLHFHL